MNTLLLLAALSGAQIERPGMLLEEAYFLEQAEGDLTGAIEIYRRVVDEYPEERALAARALLRIGLCHERLGYDRASLAYRRILADYPDQAALARLAEERLAAIERAREGTRVDLPTGATLREIVLANRTPVNDALASVSPDARRLAYEDSKMDRLVIFDMERRRAHRSVPLSGLYTNGAYRWSRDGTRLAFDEANEEGSVVRVLDVESGESSIVFRADYATVVDWGPDGGSLFIHAFARSEKASRLVHLSRRGDVIWETPASGRSFRVAPSGRLVAFVGEEGDEDIYVAPFPRPDEGVEVAPLTPDTAAAIASHPALDSDPLWSPDGRHLAFLSSRAKSWDLWVVNFGAEGVEPGPPRVLETNLGERARLRDWLPNGRLLFTKPRVLADVWIQPVSPATGEATGAAFLAPTEVRGQNAQPRWSPDGRHVSIRSQRGSSRHVLVIASVDGAPERVVSLPTEFQNADWSRNGEKLLYCAFGEEGLFLGEHDLVTGETTVAPGLRARGVFAPSMSPDGRRILFATSNERDVRMQFLFDMETGVSWSIPNTEESYVGVWSPDGQWIAIADGESVCVLRPDGSDERCLVRVDAPNRINAWIDWSPDGRFIVYPKGAYVGERFDWELSLVTFDGASHGKVGEPTELSPWWIDWSPDGEHLALSSSTGSHGLWVLEGFLESAP